MARNIDEALLSGPTLAGPASERLAGRQMREDKMAGGEGEESAPTSFRQAIMAARQAKEKIEEKITAPAKAGTNWLLKASWLNLIDSFGLTLIYINLHVFGRWVLGDKFFCKLGEEWMPKEASAVGGEAGKTAGKAVGIAEVMGLLILDLIVIFIILGALALISMIVSWYLNPIQLLTDIFNLGWDGVETLVNLFGSILKK